MNQVAANTDPIEERARRWKLAADTFDKGDRAGALFLFRALAEEGSFFALTEIGNIYELGGGGVEQDYDKARHWYEAAHRKGDINACLGLGRLYFQRLGVPKNPKKSFELFKEVEELEPRPGVLFMLGHMHEFGIGTLKDMAVAYRYYETASLAGHLLALTRLGVLDLKQGRWRAGLTRLTKATVATFRVARNNPDDPRLKVR